ncbi:alpha-glycosidase [Paenibacillus illinoisensis]|uniref:alpha-glycosidase n=1 Tax=Paenibacillus illinoisensis TaxID=59845 RepID=UPI003D2D3E85
MLLEAIYHQPKRNWAYAYDKDTVRLRLRAKKNDLTEVYAMTGDKYAWENTKKQISLTKFTSDSMFDYYEGEIKPPYHRLKYSFLLKSGDEQIWMSETGFQEEEPDDPGQMFQFPYIHQGAVFTPPEWVKDAVFYQIFPERFANGNPELNPENVEPWGGEPTPSNFFGGDLQGVMDHLDYISELGINAIYFTPIFEATTNHKYDTEDYLRVDRHFGDADTVKRLVKLCHERGIRVLLDAVFNHSGKTFAPFVDVQENGEKSKYKDWFHVHEFPLAVKDGIPTYETFGFEPHMPKLNTENPEVKDYLLKVAEYWIKEVGMDGWRLDVADEVDDAFWRDFRRVVKAANPEAYILGEIWNESSAWLQGDQFDAAMNYPFTDAVNGFFVKNKMNAETFANSIGRQLSRYPLQASEVAFNLLDSHDTPRLLTLCEGDQRKMKLAALFQFTYLGTPCIYYGDEIGLDGDHDPGCRKCMEWDEAKQDRELFTFYQQLIALRHAHPALRAEGHVQFLQARPEGSQLVLERQSEEERILILFNRSEETAIIEFEGGAGEWTELLDGNHRTARDGDVLAVELPAYGYAVLSTDIGQG